MTFTPVDSEIFLRAESSALPSGSVDLVTAAQALHWFDPAAFFAPNPFRKPHNCTHRSPANRA